MPCFRHSCATGCPAWCSFSTPMICSSVNQLSLIVRLLATDSSSDRGQPRGQGQTPCRLDPVDDTFVQLLVLFADSLRVALSVRVKKLLPAFLPRRL